MQSSQSQKKALKFIKEQGGIIRTAEALKAGIHSRTFYSLRDRGYLETVSRGVYRLAELPPISNPDFILVATRIPLAVICLISALSFHELTTQIPHEVYIALKEGCPSQKLIRIGFVEKHAHLCSD
ncbi:MAG: hypothetical protein GY702_13595 [Desulfobulbaceae bacterium]|nr:hypothetical protein [Desulfobulbaceae bacterium]